MTYDIERLENALQAEGLTTEDVRDYRMAKSDERSYTQRILNAPVSTLFNVTGIGRKLERAQRKIKEIEDIYPRAKELYDAYLDAIKTDETRHKPQ